jgi:hypothetical protein
VAARRGPSRPNDKTLSRGGHGKRLLSQQKESTSAHFAIRDGVLAMSSQARPLIDNFLLPLRERLPDKLCDIEHDVKPASIAAWPYFAGQRSNNVV